MGSQNSDIPETSVLDNTTNKPKMFFKQKFILIQETWQKLKTSLIKVDGVELIKQGIKDETTWRMTF